IQHIIGPIVSKSLVLITKVIQSAKIGFELVGQLVTAPAAQCLKFRLGLVQSHSKLSPRILEKSGGITDVFLAGFRVFTDEDFDQPFDNSLGHQRVVILASDSKSADGLLFLQLVSLTGLDFNLLAKFNDLLL